MLAAERLLEIQESFGRYLTGIAPVALEEETLQVVLYLKDGTNLRVTEQWEGSSLKRYSYYWLSAQNELKIGWDNSPHHRHLEGFPHHTHVGQQENLQPSQARCLEDVMRVVLGERRGDR